MRKIANTYYGTGVAQGYGTVFDRDAEEDARRKEVDYFHGKFKHHQDNPELEMSFIVNQYLHNRKRFLYPLFNDYDGNKERRDAVANFLEKSQLDRLDYDTAMALGEADQRIQNRR